MIRFTGLDNNDASPVIVEENGCAASIPASILSVVPLLPALSAFVGARNPVPLTPLMVAVSLAMQVCITVPSCFKHSILERTSSPKDSPETFARPLDIELSNSALCDMDLSPGTEMVPSRNVGRVTVVSKSITL